MNTLITTRKWFLMVYKNLNDLKWTYDHERNKANPCRASDYAIPNYIVPNGQRWVGHQGATLATTYLCKLHGKEEFWHTEANEILVVLEKVHIIPNTRGTRYLKVLAGGRVGWILDADWIGLETVHSLEEKNENAE